MRNNSFVHAFIVLYALTTGLAPADELYVRNQPVRQAVSRAQETYVPQAELERLLRAEELNRISYDPPRVLVDDQVVGEMLTQGTEPLIPLVKVALALGYSRRPNPSLGFTDLVSPQAQQERKKIEKRPGGQDWEISKGLMQRVLHSDGIYSWPEQQRRMETIGELLSAQTEAPSLLWMYYISNQSAPNAFTTGAGFICVSRGLLQLGLTDDELAGVLAHEMGHGMCRGVENARQRSEDMSKLSGGIEQLRQEQQRVAALLKQLYARLDELQDLYRRAQVHYQQTGDGSYVTQAENAISEVTQQIRRTEKRYRAIEQQVQGMAKSWKDKDFRNNSQLWNHGDELDADVRGLRYATMAGYNPTGMLSALVKMRRADVEKFGYWTLGADGQGDHPSLSTRIQIVEKVLKDWQKAGR